MRTEPFLPAVHTLWGRAGDGLLASGLFVASLAAYVQTLAPSVATLYDDSLEFPLVSHLLGIAHPTGYPLYTLLGKLFTLGVPQNVAWAVNLLSAVAGALTVAMVFLVTRQLTRRRLPALLGAAALAASPLFWSQSVIAEVYTVNSAFVAVLLWLALRWARRPLLPVIPFSLLLAAPRETKRPAQLSGFWSRLPPGVHRAFQTVRDTYRRLFPLVPPRRRLQPHPLILSLAAVCSLGLTHHRTLLLLVPALIVFLLLVERRILSRAALLGPEHPERPRWRQVVGRPAVLLAVALAVPLLLYLYLPLRGSVGSLDGTYVNSWHGFWGWVTASGYGVFLGENPLARDLDAAFYVDLFWQQLGPVGLALALVGLVGLVHQPKVLALTGLAFVTYVAFAIAYRVPDVEVFFLPAVLLVAIWIGVGLDDAADRLRPRGPSLALRRLTAACCLLLFLAAIVQPLAIAVRNVPDLNLSQRWAVHDYGQYLLGQPLPEDSTIVGLLGEMTLLRYFQHTAGLRPDLETLVADDEPARRRAVQNALGQGGSVYITRPLPGLADDHSLSAVTGLIDVAGDLETLIRVGEPGYEVPDVPHSTNLELVPGLSLVGDGLHEHRGHWQAWARLRLWWQATRELPESLKVSARLLDGDNRVVAAADAEPVSGAYPTTAWRPGEVVADAYEIPLPAGLPPGAYTPVVIVYDPATGAERGRVELATVSLAGNAARPPRRELEASVAKPAYALFGDVQLLGYTPPDPERAYRPAEPLPLTVLWQARGQPAGRLRLALWLEGEGAYPIAEAPMGGGFPASRWSDRQVVRQWLDPPLPKDIPTGIYRLKMRVIRDGYPVPWGRWLIPLGNDLDLGPVQVGR